MLNGICFGVRGLLPRHADGGAAAALLLRACCRCSASICRAAFKVSVIVFGLNCGAYISEIMRGGIHVGRRRSDGGRTRGRSVVRGASMMKIVIPQAVKNILPTLGNEFIALIKETSVVSFRRRGGPLRGVQLHRYELVRVHGAVPRYGDNLYCDEYCVISLGIKLMKGD